jgi:hypothetical protein
VYDPVEQCHASKLSVSKLVVRRKVLQVVCLRCCQWLSRSHILGAVYTVGQQARWDHVNRAKMAAGRCTQCQFVMSSAESSTQFHWDHIEPVLKTANICVLVTKEAPIAAIDAELAKCRLLCVNCHAHHTSVQRHTGQLKHLWTRKRALLAEAADAPAQQVARTTDDIDEDVLE